jgi:hypothetical protein
MRSWSGRGRRRRAGRRAGHRSFEPHPIQGLDARLHPACRPSLVPQAIQDALAAQFASLDSVVLLYNIRERRRGWRRWSTPETDIAVKAAIELFLEGLRHAWKEGEVRPTSRQKPPVPRG